MNGRNGIEKLRVGIACGGTGGHLFPGIALAEAFEKVNWEPLLFVAGTRIESFGLSSQSGLRTLTLPIRGFNFAGSVSFLSRLYKAYKLARSFCQEVGVRAVIGTGGYVSVPVILAARQLGIPTFLHESNAIPGRANRLLARMVDRVFVGLGPALSHIKARKVTVTGTPVRIEFLRERRTPQECRRELGLDPEADVLLVMGGSQGAMAINDLVLHSLEMIHRYLPQLQIIHVTGPRDYSRVQAQYKQRRMNHIILEFATQMPLVMRAASLAVARAGASTLAELAVMGVPAILIPYPHAVRNHQNFNAKFYERAGGVVVLPQSGATPGVFAELVCSLLANTARLSAMSEAIVRLAVPEAADRIVEIVSEVVVNSLKTAGANGRLRTGVVDISAVS